MMENDNSSNNFKRENSTNSRGSNGSYTLMRNFNSRSKSTESRYKRSKSNSTFEKHHQEDLSEFKDDEKPRENKERKDLNIMIFTFENLVRVIASNEEAKLNHLRERNKEINMYFHDSLGIPEVKGRVIIFEGNDLEKKCQATKQYFELIQGIEHTDKSINCLVFIPNGLVSMVIGTKGKQIINLAQKTKTQIAVNQPIYKMCHRTISINGNPSSISEALKKIYGIMEERYYEVKHAEQESIPMDLNEVKTTVIFLFLGVNSFVKKLYNSHTYWWS